MTNVTRIDGRPADTEADEGAEDKLVALEDMETEDFEDALPGTNSAMTFGFVSPFDVVKSTLKIRSLPDMPVRGQMDDGDTLTYTITVEVEETSFKAIYDRNKDRTGTRRHHVARVVRIDPVEL